MADAALVDGRFLKLSGNTRRQQTVGYGSKAPSRHKIIHRVMQQLIALFRFFVMFTSKI